MTVTWYYLGVCVLGEVCVCVCVWGGAFSIFRRRSVWLKLLHSIHLKAKSEKQSVTYHTFLCKSGVSSLLVSGAHSFGQ